MQLRHYRGQAPLGTIALGLVLLASGRAAAQDGKIPITTKSEEARTQYLTGRDLFEKLRATDARAHFLKAAAADKSFALAQLGLANTAPSAKDFFAALKEATALAGNATEAERHMILGLDAGTRGDLAGQKSHYDMLVAAFPKDERAANLVGGYYFGRQEFERAVAAYEQAIAVNASYSPAYNLMGYSYRALGRYDDAERTFKKYIELIPGDPNPYDSYAELLMKMGRFDDSIKSYEKALGIDPHFVASYVGIGLDQMYMGQPAKARETLAKLETVARNGGERRQAFAQTAASYLHEAKYDEALKAVEKMRAVAQQSADTATLSGDANLMANILLEAGRVDEARAKFAESLKLAGEANTPDDVKQAARRQSVFDDARVALAKGDVATARIRAKEYAEAAAAHKIPFEIRQSHEIAGLIALQQKDHATAASELAQANQQDPRVLYNLARAQQGKGDTDSARATARLAAEDNSLNFNNAYVRAKARQLQSQL